MEKTLSVKGSSLLGTSLTSSMMYSKLTYLHDPFFWVVGTLGAFISILSVLYAHHHSKEKAKGFELVTNFIKGLIAGILVAPFVFLILSMFGNTSLNSFGINITIEDETIWFLITLMLSWGAVSVLDFILLLPKMFKNVFKSKLGD